MKIGADRVRVVKLRKRRTLIFMVDGVGITRKDDQFTMG